MTAETESTLATLKRGLDVVSKLKRSAFSADAIATMALVELARTATVAVNALWFEEHPSTREPFFNSFLPQDSKHGAFANIAARREALHFLCGGHDWQTFPILAYSRKTNAEARQREMLLGLTNGPEIKVSARKKNPIRFLMEGLVLPAFREIRCRPAPPKQRTERAIWNLPQLDRSTMTVWVDAAVRWLWENERLGLRVPGTNLHQIATKVELARRDRRKESRLERLKKALHKPNLRDGLEPDDNERISRRRKRIDKSKELPATDSQIRNGLRARIAVWLTMNLPNKSAQ